MNYLIYAALTFAVLGMFDFVRSVPYAGDILFVFLAYFIFFRFNHQYVIDPEERKLSVIAGPFPWLPIMTTTIPLSAIVEVAPYRLEIVRLLADLLMSPIHLRGNLKGREMVLVKYNASDAGSVALVSAHQPVLLLSPDDPIGFIASLTKAKQESISQSPEIPTKKVD